MEGGANKTIFLGFNKGGMLILTNQRLIFKATFSSKIEEIPLASILTSGDSFNLLIPTGNMIRVCTRDGKTHQFLVVGKQRRRRRVSGKLFKYMMSFLEFGQDYGL